MQYREYNITALVTKPQLYTVNDNGEPDEFIHEFEGGETECYEIWQYDGIAHEFLNDEFETTSEAKQAIDKHLEQEE